MLKTCLAEVRSNMSTHDLDKARFLSSQVFILMIVDVSTPLSAPTEQWSLGRVWKFWNKCPLQDAQRPDPYCFLGLTTPHQTYHHELTSLSGLSMRTCINKHVGQTAESKPDLTILRALYSHVGHWLSASFSSSCGLLDGLVVMKLRKTLVTPRKIVKSNHQITAFFILFPTKISPHGVLSLGSQHLHRTILESL